MKKTENRFKIMTNTLEKTQMQIQNLLKNLNNSLEATISEMLGKKEISLTTYFSQN